MKWLVRILAAGSLLPLLAATSIMLWCTILYGGDYELPAIVKPLMAIGMAFSFLSATLVVIGLILFFDPK